VIDDLGPFMSWYGVAMAAAAVACVSLRDRALPLWIGVVGVLGFLAPVVVLALSGLSGVPGVVDPLWLMITAAGIALALRRSHAPAPRGAAAE
jgi:hypothetical protein